MNAIFAIDYEAGADASNELFWEKATAVSSKLSGSNGSPDDFHLSTYPMMLAPQSGADLLSLPLLPLIHETLSISERRS